MTNNEDTFDDNITYPCCWLRKTPSCFYRVDSFLSSKEQKIYSFEALSVYRCHPDVTVTRSSRSRTCQYRDETPGPKSAKKRSRALCASARRRKRGKRWKSTRENYKLRLLSEAEAQMRSAQAKMRNLRTTAT